VGRSRQTGAKGGPSGVARTAEEPGQTVNVDLCFVPAVHETDHRLPAVSGSSGRLVVAQQVEESSTERSWPGRAFDDPSVDYAEAMQAFVAASAAPPLPPSGEQMQELEEARRRKEAHRLRCQQETTLRDQRRQVRVQRQQEDAAWRVLVAARRGAAAPQTLDTRQAQEEQWRQLRAQRRATLDQRQEQDTAWRQQRRYLRDAADQRPCGRAWIAVLVLTDNCTRQCLGLPLFVAGSKVTATEVRDALRALLPPELQFLISDRGTHFTAHELAGLARERDFIHVLIARHRPESNGIAERFVRTLKEWLAEQTWTTADELAALLVCFQAEYNDRPHQGLSLPGLSPNEYAQRIWLM
jgi:transposase InsO family protein